MPSMPYIVFWLPVRGGRPPGKRRVDARRASPLQARRCRAASSQQDGAGLRHVERIEGAGQRDMQHLRAALGHAGPQSLVLVAEHQHGRQAQGFLKGIDGGSSAAARAGKWSNPLLRHCPAHAPDCRRGQWGAVSSAPARRPLCGRAEVGVLCRGSSMPAPAQRVKGAAERPPGCRGPAPGQGQASRGRGGLMHGGEHAFQRLELRDGEGGPPLPDG